MPSNSGQGTPQDPSARPVRDGSSRDRIVQNYAAQGAARARNARMYSQEASMAYKENAARARERAAQREAIDARRREEEAMRAALRAQQRDVEAANARTQANLRERDFRASRPRTRVTNPLSTQESHDSARGRAEYYERARAERDALSTARRRTTDREVIDGRGSVDSRALNERNQLVGYTINEDDRHDPMLDVNESKSRWRSHSGDGFSDGRKQGIIPNRPARQGLYASTGSHPLQPTQKAGPLAGIPPLVKILVPVLVVLAVILFFIVNP